MMPRCHNKPFPECTDQELKEELAYWEERIASAGGWGSAVGAASGFIKDIKQLLKSREAQVVSYPTAKPLFIEEDVLEETAQKMPTIESTLSDRRKTHGDFADVAATMQETKKLWREKRNWDVLSPLQQAVLDEVAHKVARILHGDPNFKEHWHDMVGYARLAEKELEK